MKSVLKNRDGQTCCPVCLRPLSALREVRPPSDGRFQYVGDLYETNDSIKEHISGNFGICRNCNEVYFMYEVTDQRTCWNCQHCKHINSHSLLNIDGRICLMKYKSVRTSACACDMIDEPIREIPEYAHCAFCEHRKIDKSGKLQNNCNVLDGHYQYVPNNEQTNCALRSYFEENKDEASIHDEPHSIIPCPMFKADYWKYLKYREDHEIKEDLFDEPISIREFDERYDKSRKSSPYEFVLKLPNLADPTITDVYRINITVEMYDTFRGNRSDFNLNHPEGYRLFSIDNGSTSIDQLQYREIPQIKDKIANSQYDQDWIRKNLKPECSLVPEIMHVKLKDFFYYGGPLEGDKASGMLYFKFTDNDITHKVQCYVYLDADCTKELCHFNMYESELSSFVTKYKGGIKSHMFIKDDDDSLVLKNDCEGYQKIRYALQEAEDEFRSIPGNSITSY